MYVLSNQDLEGLLTQSEVHRGEGASLSTGHQRGGGGVQEVTHTEGALGEDANELERLQETRHHGLTDPGVLNVGRSVLGHQRLVPLGIHTFLAFKSTIALFQNHPAGLLQCSIHLFGGGNIGKTVTFLDTLLDGTMLGVVRVILVGHAPLVGSEESSGLHNTHQLSVAGRLVRSMSGGLTLVHSVEGVILKRQLHKVALLEGDQVSQTLSLCVVLGTLDLVLVESDTSHIDVGKTSDGTSRSTNTASSIQHLLSGLQLHLHSQPVLVTSERGVETLVLGTHGEMEAATPTILIKVSGQTVVLVHQSFIVHLALLQISLVKVHVLVDRVLDLFRRADALTETVLVFSHFVRGI
mmetsp:Transcript_25277/g.63400  ORF Transcript_25277/g.63400 Transcript_25277/m.63400 type:complete len:353 (-) Transcript_25277:171-1229(-)